MKKIYGVLFVVGVLLLGGCFTEKEEEPKELISRSKFYEIVDLMKESGVQKRGESTAALNGLFVYSSERNQEVYYGVNYLVDMEKDEIDSVLVDMYDANSLGKNACFVLSGKALKYVGLGSYSGPDSFTIPIEDLIPGNKVVFDKGLNKEVQANGTQDIQKPVITLQGENEIYLDLNSSYNELGATATDNIDGDITSLIEVDSSSVNTEVSGTYEVTYNVTDAAGNVADEIIRTVNVGDYIAPVIELTQGNLKIEYGETYDELGATATDNIDGDITSNIVIDSSALDINSLGIYEITYNVEDAAGNKAEEKVRTVEVVDTTAPEISLEGSNSITVVKGETYNEPGVTATDNVDGDISTSVDIDNSTLDTSTVGTYEIRYNVTDSSGNIAQEKTRVITVIESSSIIPTFTPNIAIVINRLEMNFEVTDSTITKLIVKEPILEEIVELDVTSGIASGEIEIATQTNELLITGLDASGNSVEDVVITTNNDFVDFEISDGEPQDITAPVVTLNGETVIDIYVGDEYVEQGAEAIDDTDGDITDQIIIDDSEVDTNNPGSYVVRYTSTDSSGNQTEEQRVINVLDTTTNKINPTISSEDALVYVNLTMDIEVTDPNITEVTIITELESWTDQVVGGSINREIQIAKETGETSLILVGKDSLGKVVESVEVSTSDNYSNYEVTQKELIKGSIIYDREGLIGEIYNIDLTINDPEIFRVEFEINGSIVGGFDVVDGTIQDSLTMADVDGKVKLLAENSEETVIYTVEMDLIK